ncbi:MAG: DUF1801 domain-containing protein [Phycisphaerae bacterium]|jgi:hypothetical protein
MPPKRLEGHVIADLMRDWPDELCDLALGLRDFVLRVAPEAGEKIAFHALCYYKSDAPYGVIGGNICMISPKIDVLHLGFIHGAHLPDPEGILQGAAKSARYIALRTTSDIRRRPFQALVRAAVDFDPASVA